jgi:D-glycero-D-manno-heptose 1,7-bisphosphate phosphatase
MTPAIFLDRDGTIIVDKVYLNDPSLVEFMPNAIEGLKKFKALGFKLIVVTNQSGIARGLVTTENLEKIHERMTADLAAEGISIDGYYHSPHAAGSNHPTRKPNPGMIEAGIADHDIDRENSWMIGDRMGDVGAGHNAQLKTILLTSSKEQITTPMPTLTCDDLLDCANFISTMTP